MSNGLLTALVVVMCFIFILIAGACVVDIVKEIVEWIKEIYNG